MRQMQNLHLTQFAYDAIIKRMNILRERRHDKGLTLVEAAKLLGTDTGNLSRIERGLQYPSVTLAHRIAMEYGVSFESIFSGTAAA